ncbi:hypothetical protein ACJA88_015076 [Fusarium oxysporum]
MPAGYALSLGWLPSIRRLAPGVAIFLTILSSLAMIPEVSGMYFVSRKQWNAQPPKEDYTPIANPKGIKIHYLGSLFLGKEHSECDNQMRSVQSDHMSGEYFDVAYSLAVCQHGYVYDGRGKGHQCGANGDKQLNANHYAVLAFFGKNGVSQPSQSQVTGIQDAIAYLRRAGAGNEIKGHRDGYNTECPGEPLYKLVKNGTLDPAKLWNGGTHEVEPNETLGGISLKYNVPQRYVIDVNKLKAPYDLKVGEKLEIPARGVPLVITAMGKRLVAAGCNKYSEGAGPQWTSAHQASYKCWQEKLGYTGADADGWPGESSWSKLEVPWTKDGDVGNQTLAPFPDAEWFKSKPNSPTVTAMGKRLVAVGCNKYSEGSGPQWTVSDQNSYKCWQEKLGFTGSDADGWPGKTSWDKLRVPKTSKRSLG